MARLFSLCALLAVVSAGCSAPSSGGLTSSWRPSWGPFARNDEPSTKLQLSWARLQEDQGKPAEARTAYRQVLEKDPRSLDALLGLARLDMLAGRPEEAEQGFQRALALNPESAQVHDALGSFYAEQERWEEGIQHFQAAVEAAPDEKLYRFHLAVTLTKSGRTDEALTEFTQAVGPAEAHYNVGRILYDLGNQEAAEQQFLVALTRNPHLEAAQLWLRTVRAERDPSLLAKRTPPQPVTPVPAQSAPLAGVPAAVVSPIATTGPASVQTEATISAGGTVGPVPAAERAFGAFGAATANVVAPAQAPASQMPPGLTLQQREQMQNQSRR